MRTFVQPNVPQSAPEISKSTSSSSNGRTEDGTLYPRASPVQTKLGLRRQPSRASINSTSDESFFSQDSYPIMGDLDNSIIWHIYNEEASKFDASVVEASHREIDVLLVFTGLFSAVLTTFIIQAYQMMLPDPTDRTNELLSAFLAIQINNTNIPGFPQLTNPGINGHTPDPGKTQIHWVNGLWFSALACSLSTALISMLAKQWLHAYTRDISGSPRDRARRRQNRFMRFRSWHVLAVVHSLPLLLHAALLLFFGGVIVMLWTDEVAISTATIIIVGSAYVFYLGSMWISLIFPDCPYQHPVSVHLLRLFKRERGGYKMFVRRGSSTPKDKLNTSRSLEELENLTLYTVSHLNQTSPPRPEDVLDASALIWLIEESTSTEHTRSSALQAIAGLPRDFTAYHLLHQAGAVERILDKFESCFQLDVTLDNQWSIKDANAAGSFCRAWLRLTYQTNLRWPPHLLQPLRMLCHLTAQPTVSAAATCILALNSLEAYGPQNDLLSLLSRHVDGGMKLSWSVQQDILDTLLECTALWELPGIVIAEIVSRAVPLLTKLLHLMGNTGCSSLRNAISLNLYTLTGKFLEQDVRREEVKRADVYRFTSIQALSDMVQRPTSYGVQDESFLDILTPELTRFAGVLVTKPQEFPPPLRESAKIAFTTLYLQKRVTARDISEHTLADVLQLLQPATLFPPTRRKQFILCLIDTLKRTRHPDVTRNALRLLDSQMDPHSLDSLEPFMEGGGLETLLHIASTGNRVDGQILQTDSLRILCTFVQASADSHLNEGNFLSSHFDTIIQSDFLNTLCAVATTGRSWLKDVVHIWAPAMVALCRVRPVNPIWRNVERTFWKYADSHQIENDYDVLLGSLHQIRELRLQFDEEAESNSSLYGEDI